MKMKQVAVLLPLVVLSLADRQASAVEALSSLELASHCEVYKTDPNGEDGIFCVRYIQGFIDGAVVTDERVTYNVADEADRSESFSDRVARTRVGSRINRYGPSYYAEFCLGEPLPLKTVVDQIVIDLSDAQRLRNLPLARDMVYATLRREYPCQVEEE